MTFADCCNIPITLIDRDGECKREWVLKKSLRLAGEI